METKKVEMKLNSGTLILETGKMAKQANGSVFATFEGSSVLATVCAGRMPETPLDYVPLQVEYNEKYYAAGKIPGGFLKREGRPKDKEILVCRLIDRPMRPLFDKSFGREIQVVPTVISSDMVNPPDIIAMIASSAAVTISDIPFNGPIAAVRVALIGNEYIINPTFQQIEEALLEIIVAGTEKGITMVEGGAKQVSEEQMLQAIETAQPIIADLCAVQLELAKLAGKEKLPLMVIDNDMSFLDPVREWAYPMIKEASFVKGKAERHEAIKQVKAEAQEKFAELLEASEKPDKFDKLFEELEYTILRSSILDDGVRVDGRKVDEIRKISCEVGVLARAHGSALFTRGETQALATTTLGTSSDEQMFDTIDGDKHFHYNFPPYSVGEVKRPGGPSRRDIGHGNLAHRALEKVIPSQEDFEYTIRLVGEVTESNGSSSMGTVCSGCLALMDGGVPIKAPVSGIAMGLVKDGDKTVVLSDILGDEDHFGDMDFKVAGTKEGITALQMDIKINELSKEIMQTALNQANAGRIHILEKMLETLDKSRDDVSPHAPKIVSVQIHKDKIRDIIGPGGKVIRALQSDTNTTIEVNDDGIVKIAAENEEDSARAVAMVKDIAMDPEIGAIYEGPVVKITDFGAFVNIKSGTDGLVHISELADYRVKKVTDVVKEGETIKVKVLDITRDGKIKLSLKAAKKDAEKE